MPEKVAEMKKTLSTYLREVEAQMPTINPNYDPNAEAPHGRGPGSNRPSNNRSGKTGRNSAAPAWDR